MRTLKHFAVAAAMIGLAAVATLNKSVTDSDSAKFFKATIEVPWVDNGEEFEPGPEEP